MLEACAPGGIRETITRAGRVALAGGLTTTPQLGLVSQRLRSTGQPSHRHRRKRQATAPKVLRFRPHCVQAIHWARKGETVSRMTCHCGARFVSHVEPSDALNLNFCHRRLEALYARHRREVGATHATEGCL